MHYNAKKSIIYFSFEDSQLPGDFDCGILELNVVKSGNQNFKDQLVDQSIPQLFWFLLQGTLHGIFLVSWQTSYNGPSVYLLSA